MYKPLKNLIFNLVAFAMLVSGISAQAVTPRIIVKKTPETKRDKQLEKAIMHAAEITEPDDKTTRYYYNFVDLNDDGISEALVYIFSRNRCGSSGCDAYLFKKVNNSYKLINHFEPVRNPIIVSNKKTNGWKDLIFFNSGGGILPGYYSVCRYNGTSYPENPTGEEEAPRLTSMEKGVAYLVGKGYGNSGLAFNFK